MQYNKQLQGTKLNKQQKVQDRSKQVNRKKNFYSQYNMKNVILNVKFSFIYLTSGINFTFLFSFLPVKNT